MSDGTGGERQFRIHPAIGFARLGNAARLPTEGRGWFVGPESPEAVINASPHRSGSQSFKGDGGVLAQGVRFRIFEYRDGGAHEVVPNRDDVMKITWQVQLVNRKAAFFQFWGPVGRGSIYNTPVQQFSWLARNRHIARHERHDKLTLDSGVCSIESHQPGKLVDLLNINPLTRPFIDLLGQLIVDKAGHLIVLGGRGKSVFVPTLRPGVEEARSLTTYANNDGWFDDVADGPVSATLHFRDGHTQAIAQADGAWVVSAPPDFAPGVRPIRSMWDTLVDVFVRSGTPAITDDLTHRAGYSAQLALAWDRRLGKFQEAFRPSFIRTIYPILAAAGQLISSHSMPTRSMAHRGFGDTYMSALGGPSSDGVLRRKVFERIRPPRKWIYDTTLMPLSHGDLYFDATPDAPLWRRLLHRILQVPGRLLTVSDVQYALLQKWQAGCFEADWDPDNAKSVDAVVTPAGLDEAALREASGGAFVPGIECSWLLTNPKVFRYPFRLAQGRIVTANTFVGPIEVSPGMVTAQMALPWQADFADCKKEPVIGELVQVAWWPWQRPDDVLRGGTANRENLGWTPWAPSQDSIDDDSKRFLGMVDHWHDFDFIAEQSDGSIGPQEKTP